MSFQQSTATNRRLVYSPDCNSSSKQNCGLLQSGTRQKFNKKNYAETPTKVKNKRRLQKLSFKSIEEVQGKHCCRKRCLQGGKAGLSKSDIMACRKEFWKLDENEQRNYILTFFHTNAIKSSGRQNFIYLVARNEVCNSCWIECHGMSRWRFFTLKNEFENGRNTSDTAKGLFRMRSNRSMDAELWFENYRDTLADKMPDSCYYHLPSCQTKKTVYTTYVEETNKKGEYKPLSHAQFLRMWREKFKRVVIPKTSRFSKCGVCVLLKEHLQSTSGKLERASWLEKKRLHIEQQWEERKKYYKHVKKSISNPAKYLSLIVDGMDQGKTHLPHCLQKSKIEKGSSGFLPTHVTGVIAHGQDLKFCFVDLLKWPADANTTINVILAVLKFIKEKIGVSPPVLYLQMDNCFRDCKNIYIFGFCALLVKMGVFRKVKLSYLMVGHTHEDVDQMFSRISATLGRQSAHTLLSLHEAIHASFSPEPITADLSSIWDVKSWLQPYIPALKNHSRHHSFRFQKGSGKYAEHIEMCYRNWSKCKRKEWLPTKAENVIRTLDVLPTGSPSILRPEYSKCPSVDELRAGLQQFNSRLSVDESNWWLNFIKTEEEQRLSWERRSDEELQAAGKSSFPLKDLLYREVKSDMKLTSDEATEKRIAELEKLMDKNSTFPEIKEIKRKKK